MGTWMAWANEDPSKLLCKRTCNFGSWWDVANPRTTMQFFNENHIRLFELSTWTDEGDFSFIFLHSWHNLRLRWISCPLQFSAYIVGFFLASIDFIPFFKVATKEFSFHSTPNTLLFLSGVTGLFLHVRCTPQQNSHWQFWASVCTIWIDVRPLIFAGACGTHVLTRMQWSCGRWVWRETWPVSNTCMWVCVYIYMHRYRYSPVPKSQLGGHIFCRCCFILPTSHVILTCDNLCVTELCVTIFCATMLRVTICVWQSCVCVCVTMLARLESYAWQSCVCVCVTSEQM